MEFGDTRLLTRYWDKVQQGETPDDCWLWVGARSSAGYGQLRVDGKALLAHRIIAEVAHGDSGGLFCLHSCDAPACVNPRHLRWGTAKDNMADRKERGRENYPPLRSRTHCPRNHEYSEENSYITKAGTQACRVCYRDHWRAWNERRKAKDYKTDRVPLHGTANEYRWGCRCRECTDAATEQTRQVRARKKGMK